MKEKVILNIVEIEWEMFSRTNNLGGRARCQEDPETFHIMRTSQAESWSEELLHSYYNDLIESKKHNRNLMTEKYARMMESTYPEEYKAFADKLPDIDDKTLELIELIIDVNLQWKLEMLIKYPRLTKKGRFIYTKEDTENATSFETYLRGELKTYSSKTIQLYYDMTLDQWNNGVNAEEIYLLNIVKKYGYKSLEEAEKSVQ